jgi:hypothetical protein
MIRALLGAAAGAIAGLGLYFTWWRWTTSACDEVDGPDCGVGVFAVLPLFLFAWMIAGSTLLFWALKLLKRADTWPAAGIGCALWIPLWFVGALTGLTRTLPMEIALIGTPVLAYALAAAFTGWSRGSAPGNEQAVPS